jgi:hypothetical protein
MNRTLAFLWVIAIAALAMAPGLCPATPPILPLAVAPTPPQTLASLNDILPVTLPRIARNSDSSAVSKSQPFMLLAAALPASTGIRGTSSNPLPLPGFWDPARAWMRDHRLLLYGLVLAQVLVLASVSGLVFRVTRRRAHPNADQGAMNEQKFNCPACGQKIACPPGAVGAAIHCPTCQAAFAVPAPRPAAAALQARAAALGVSIQTEKNYCRLGIASLISSAVFGIGWLPGIICGHMAKARIRRDPLLDGETMANGALLISYLGLLSVLGVSVVLAVTRQDLTPPAIVRNQPGALADLGRRVVDEVLIGDVQSESSHGGFWGGDVGVWQGRKWRAVQWSGRIIYTMKVLPDRRMTLNCHFGDNPNDRHFDVFVEGQQIGTEVFKFNVPGHFYDVEYSIPASLTRGKSSVRVEFRAPMVMTAARLYGCQILKP